MKTKKLWIWSFIFGLLATVVLYIMVSSNDDQKVVKTDAPVGDSNESKETTGEPTPTTTNEGTTQTITPTNSEEEETGNELLPLADGKRAMSIQVTDVQGISGFIKPGSHVDIVANLIPPDDVKKGQHPAQTIVIQNAKVLALGHAADDAETMKRYQLVTLEVNPKESLTLGFATKYEYYLLLRKDGDNKLEPTHTHVYDNELHEGVFEK